MTWELFKILLILWPITMLAALIAQGIALLTTAKAHRECAELERQAIIRHEEHKAWDREIGRILKEDERLGRR